MNNYTFTHEGKTFEVRVAQLNGRVCVKVFLDEAQVSPEYSVTWEVRKDYFSQHQKSMVSALVTIAESDVRKGIYLKA